MSIEDKIKKILAEDDIKDVNDKNDENLNEDEKGNLIKAIEKALSSDSNKSQTVNGVKNLSKADLQVALGILNGNHSGFASNGVKELLGNLVEEEDYEDDDDEDDDKKSKKDDGEIKDASEEEDDDDEDDKKELKESMSKKDFIPIAAIVKAVEDLKTRQKLANKLGNLFAGSNPNFNSSIWHKACGTKENVDESADDEDDDVEIKDIKEDIGVMFNGETLTEDFKTKASTIFESAVVSRVKKEVSEISKKLNEEKDNELREQKEQLNDLIDGYLGIVAEQWLTDNEIALENSLKTEMFENFIDKMKSVFVESYIEVPEEKFDVLAEKENEILKITEQLRKATETLIESRRVINSLEREKLIAEATEKMSQTDKERFIELTESFEFDVTEKDDFSNRIEIIKESYFGTNTKKTPNQKFISDNKVLIKEGKTTTVHPDVAGYL